MSYTFTASQQAQITQRFQMGPPENQPGNFIEMYGYVAQELAAPGLADPAVNATRLWFTGAFYANGGGGSPSTLIREFTQTQGVLHRGKRFSEGTGFPEGAGPSAARKS